MTMEKTKGEIFTIFETLIRCGSMESGSPKFRYNNTKVLLSLKKEYDATKSARVSKVKFVEYENVRIKLLRKHASRDAKGAFETVMNPTSNQFDYLLNDWKKFEKELDVMKLKYKDAIKSEEEKNEKFSELLKETVEINIEHKIKVKLLPSEMTSEDQMIIWDFIEDDEPEIPEVKKDGRDSGNG
jgi:hypothetical protein